MFDFAGTFGRVALQQILDTMCRDNPSNHTVRDLIMRFNRIGTALFVSALFAAAPAMAQTPYDGLWSVRVVTKTGSCEPEMGVWRCLHAQVGKDVVDDTLAHVTGSIGREGLVKVSIGGAYANGQLSGNAGSGKWNGASAGIPCSGRWEASRQ